MFLKLLDFFLASGAGSSCCSNGKGRPKKNKTVLFLFLAGFLILILVVMIILFPSKANDKYDILQDISNPNKIEQIVGVDNNGRYKKNAYRIEFVGGKSIVVYSDDECSMEVPQERFGAEYKDFKDRYNPKIFNLAYCKNK